MLSVLDTSVLIAASVSEIPGRIAISIVSIAELQFGVLVAPDDASRAHRLARLSAIQSRFDPLPVDDAVSASYAELAAVTHRLGRRTRARSLDLLIAATALAHGARLVTANERDFKHLRSHLEIVPAG